MYVDMLFFKNEKVCTVKVRTPNYLFGKRIRNYKRYILKFKNIIFRILLYSRYIYFN